MLSCTYLCPLQLFLLFLPFHAAPAQATPPTEADVRARIQQLEQTKVQADRLEALQWLQKHAAAKGAALAIPLLEKTIRDDPDAKIREEAVLALSDIARKQKLPCPLALVQAIFDKDQAVRQAAAALSTQRKVFAPGTVELAFRAARSEDTYVRSYGLDLLASAAPRDEKALAVIETAKNDRSFQLRHSAHCYKFKATDRLDEFLAWQIRLQMDRTVLDPIPADKELRDRDESFYKLLVLFSATQILDWSEKRPDDLAVALVQLLDHASPLVRTGAARLIGVAAAKTDLAKPNELLPFEKAAEYLYPESQPGAPKPRLKKSKVAPCLEKRKARERLEKLSESDPDRGVRGAALLTLDRLGRLQGKP